MRVWMIVCVHVGRVCVCAGKRVSIYALRCAALRGWGVCGQRGACVCVCECVRVCEVQPVHTAVLDLRFHLRSRPLPPRGDMKAAAAFWPAGH